MSSNPSVDVYPFFQFLWIVGPLTLSSSFPILVDRRSVDLILIFFILVDRRSVDLILIFFILVDRRSVDLILILFILVDRRFVDLILIFSFLWIVGPLTLSL